MRCPKCGALAADSDPYCLWCGKGLNHSRSARPDPTGRSGPGGQPSLAARMLVGIGVAAMILGMFVVRMVVEGNPLSDFKGVIAGVVCVFVPMLGLCFLVWLLGKSRGTRTNDQ